MRWAEFEHLKVGHTEHLPNRIDNEARQFRQAIDQGRARKEATCKRSNPLGFN
jgi:hypothetical protein